MGTNTIQYIQCRGYNRKCKNQINDGSHKSGRLPELCEKCKRAKDLDSLKQRQLEFRLRRAVREELQN